MKEIWRVFSARLLQQLHLLGERTVISDAAWTFQHDLEIKHQDVPRRRLSKDMVMFLHIKGSINYESLPSKQADKAVL
jgi:hypothetical protein